jgi:hypothetical protein
VNEGFVGDYFGQLKASKFCLAPYGHGWGIRTGLYMAQGEARPGAAPGSSLGAARAQRLSSGLGAARALCGGSWAAGGR